MKGFLRRGLLLTLIITGNKGTIDSSSDSDGFGEEVIYSQKSPKMDEIIRDFDWELGRFVEYRSPFNIICFLFTGNKKSLYNCASYSKISLDFTVES